jgi:glycosyltransferase involved in cell wall biosynthesis
LVSRLFKKRPQDFSHEKEIRGSKNFQGEESIALFLFPFNSNSILAIGEKIATILSNTCHSVLIISSGIPPGFKWPDRVSSLDLDLGRLKFLGDRRKPYTAVILWIMKNLRIQLSMGREIFMKRNQFNIVFFALGGFFQIPIIVGKLLGKQVVVFVGGESSLIASILYGKFQSLLLRIGNSFNYSLSDLIIVETDTLKESKILRKFRTKVRNGALYFGDSEFFSNRTPLSSREGSVAYIGRISMEKGVLEFSKAIPALIQTEAKIRIFIIGSGPLEGDIDQYISNHLNKNVIRIPWVEETEIPTFLNKIKLLVMPSKIEGLPNILLEAISCGTAVLATPVGGIPDIIQEGHTGFVLETLEPGYVAEKILSLLQDEFLLEETNRNANELIQTKYSFAASVNRYTTIFDEFFTEK